MKMKTFIYFVIIFSFMVFHPKANLVLIESGIVGHEHGMLATLVGIPLAAFLLALVTWPLLDIYNKGFHELWPAFKLFIAVVGWPYGFLVLLFGDPVYMLIKKQTQKRKAVNSQMATSTSS